MGRTHHYSTSIRWTGNPGHGTAGYTAYSRDHELETDGKPVLLLSSDPAFRGSTERYNPEELLLASLSSCHMLWYLHLCAEAGITVTGYTDAAGATMQENAGGGGRFTGVLLQPVVTVTPGTDTDRALELHHSAHEKCYIAASCNFPVRHKAQIITTP